MLYASDLFVYGNACIGEMGTGTAAGASVSGGECSNGADASGGGIYSFNGHIYLGYKNASTPAVGGDKWTGGIYRNYAADGGGGIFLGNYSELLMAGGNVSRNMAATTDEYGGGGAIYIHSEAEKAVISGGKIEQNKTAGTGGNVGGGAVYNLKSLEITGGEICENSANKGGAICNGQTGSEGTLSISGGKIHDNTADTSGGAVCQVAGTFSMSGSPYIPYGVTAESGGTPTTLKGAGKNDVYLANNQYITVDGSVTLPTGASGANATITPSSWTRGIVVAQGKNNTALPAGNEYATSIKYRLALAGADGDGWEAEFTSDEKKAKIFAPIYVAAAGAYDATTNPGGYRKCGSKGLDTNIGTKSAPYATVTKALTDLKDSSKDRKIYIDGKVTDNVSIKNGSSSYGGNVLAQSLTLTGATTTSITEETADCLDGGGADRTLYIKPQSGSMPVT
ncbi:MAG: hypothetical protein J5700_05625, partial [Treponema sp.]|nr:hypothetical protein [Treponema sp.]